MLVLLSPAKKQNHETPIPQQKATQIQTKKYVSTLVDTLTHFSKSQLKTLMNISDNIATLNHHRFQEFDTNTYNRSNAKQAVFAFQGDAYRALAVETLSQKAIDFMQTHLLILSGLYGYLRPLDLIQAYRLEMKIPLKTPETKDLYQFWGDKITQGINTALINHQNKTVINLASTEYFKAVNPEKLKGKLLTLHFKEKKQGQYKTIGINAKRARGMMTRFIMENALEQPQKLQCFNEAGYTFNTKLSSAQDWIFTRD